VQRTSPSTIGAVEQNRAESYSQEQSARAKTVAGRHRLRAARKHGLTERFTAREWLHLCATFGFRCICCDEEAPLEPHDRLDLCLGGTNTIENIEPICRSCQKDVPVGALELGNRWLREQDELLNAFAIGDQVGRRHNQRAKTGVIVEMLAAQRGPRPVRGTRSHTAGRLAHLLTDWVEASARIRWPRGQGTYYAVMPLKDLVKLEEGG
jgi:hypothetical protein